LTPSAKIVVKIEFRSRWKEITIQWGRPQFLAVGGFYGEQGKPGKTAFLGSALLIGCSLNDNESFEIVAPFFSHEIEQTTRHLRDQSKVSAALP
jgi:hypothetical protein